MTARERRATLGLASVFSMRMLGLFLVLPVFALYAHELAGATPMMIGLAIGAYGLTQALLQIPLGMASDRWGRRPVIVAGLLLFALGSVVAALSESIYGVIAGRALQGTGAVAAAAMAMAADLTRDSQRTKIMAVIGISIGFSFLLALMLGPVIAGWWGLSGVFWFTAVMALAGIGVMYLLVPTPEQAPAPAGMAVSEQGRLWAVFKEPNLFRLDSGIFVLHLILTASFVVMPIALRDQLGVADNAHWRVYIPVLLASVVGMVPLLALGERRRQMHRLLGYVVLMLAAASFLLAFSVTAGVAWLWFALWLYFVAFNTLEASLPSMVSRYAPLEAKGAAMGVYSTSQFFGAFVGGVAGGGLYTGLGIEGVFAFCGVIALGWFFLARGLSAPVQTELAEAVIGDVKR
ncbi:MFS transporter [Alkalilimnicola ehrlichii]|uniref:MFS transporter n=3 Tax=Alkalilimnicola ehrlichii TaxID=351052 RepID=A0A3E0WY72_9GAMM|nr:MFS transporter [Alkalilimnicola ehrlichii]